MRLFRKLRRKLDYLPKEQVDQVQAAFLVAFEAHKPQRRSTGEAYITHPVAVACILAEYRLDAETIMAAILHDVIEDTPVTREELAGPFGEKVAELVDGVSKLTKIEFRSKIEFKAENLRKMILAMAKDIRVILVKLADRLHNMRTLGALRAAKRRRIARETLDIYAPIGRRLGMRDISIELEELGFKALYPLRYRVMQESVHKGRGNRKKVLNIIYKSIEEGLKTGNLGAYVIRGREKNLYSIYRKMQKKHLPFNEVMDVYAFRIVVDSIDNCYRVLGLIHNLFKPVPERFKDYIAIPKNNGYQSLHTTLFGPYGLPIEVQIRTTEMDQLASSGIAAHWMYKSTDQSAEQSHLNAQKWVMRLIDLHKSSSSPMEFLENVKIDLFPDEVFVFTPKGAIKELPAGSTVIDFAYAVHTSVGNQSVAAKVDRQLVPLSTPLINGQTVEVVTSVSARPNPAWLDFVVTSKARNSVKDFLKSQKRSQSISLGEQLLKQSLAQFSIVFSDVSDEIITYLLKEAEVKSLDNLFAEIGLGDRVAMIVARRVASIMEEQHAQEYQQEQKLKQAAPMQIKGTEGMVLHLEECCRPIPGDPIIGVFQAGHGVRIHRGDCPHTTKIQYHLDRFTVLRWDDGVQGDFPTKISVQLINQRGVLAIIAVAISDMDSGIDDIQIKERAGEYYLVDFKLFVKNIEHVELIIKQLSRIDSVIKVSRVDFE